VERSPGGWSTALAPAPALARPVAALPSALALAAGSEVRAARVIAWRANAMTAASRAAS
jgi:hypothetical protein